MAGRVHRDRPVLREVRRRLTTLLCGPAPTLGQQTRATVAIGVLGDCTVMFADVPEEELKTAVLDAVCATLG